MKMKSLFILLSLICIVSADKWAVLVSGSTTFNNYRHQADLAHSYHILIHNGYSPEHIIVMSYNDVPKSPMNPFPNTLYNHPGENPINYNENLVVDYQGNAVNPENFKKVLTGDESAGNKVLKTTKDDIIFLAYFDHGEMGMIMFPDNRVFSRRMFEETVVIMHEKNMYKHIVFYLEACYSGSMIETLPDDYNIYAISAASDDEESFAYYCWEKVNGVEIDTCLGDEFSIKWMENVDEGNLKQTFAEHYQYIKENVAESHVQKGGDFSFINEPISMVFEGNLAHIKNSIHNSHSNSTRHSIYTLKLESLKRRYMRTSLEEDKHEYEKEAQLIESIDIYFKTLITKMETFGRIKSTNIYGFKNEQCYYDAVEHVLNLFGESDYLLKYFKVLNSLCEQYPKVLSYL